MMEEVHKYWKEKIICVIRYNHTDKIQDHNSDGKELGK